VGFRRDRAVLASCVAAVLALAPAGCGGSSSLGAGGRGGTAGTGGAGTGGAGGTGGTGGGADGSVWSRVDASPDGLLSDLHQQLDAARATWAQTKSGCTTYSYDRRRISRFSGTEDSTQVEIRNDAPTWRRVWNGNVFADGGSWVLAADQRGSQIGQDAGADWGFPASTVEQLLAECDTILARDPAEYVLDLELSPDAGGVPWICTYRGRGCSDDCEVGIRLAQFACAPLDGGGPQ